MALRDKRRPPSGYSPVLRTGTNTRAPPASTRSGLQASPASPLALARQRASAVRGHTGRQPRPLRARSDLLFPTESVVSYKTETRPHEGCNVTICKARSRLSRPLRGLLYSLKYTKHTQTNMITYWSKRYFSSKSRIHKLACLLKLQNRKCALWRLRLAIMM